MKTYNINLITKLRINISLKQNTTYWAFVNSKWKRISYTYFLDLKLLGIETIGPALNKQSGNISTNKKAYIKDQFYTPNILSTFCINLYSKVVTVSKSDDIIIEPSAGSGAFIPGIKALCNNTVFIDVDPKHSAVDVADFLNFNIDLSKFKKVHILGNPPFSLIKKFIKKGTGIANTIGFILPLSFRKDSRKKLFPLNYHCIHETILLNNKFMFQGTLKTIPTVFQIWEKQLVKRISSPLVSSKYIRFVKKNNNPVLAFRRVGSRCGEISLEIQDKCESSFYFIKLINGLDILTFCEAYKKVVFFHENTVGPKSISQQELLLALSRYGV